MAKRKKTQTAASRNLPYIRAMLGKWTSGAAGKHADRRDKRTRTRAAKRTRALGDW